MAAAARASPPGVCGRAITVCAPPDGQAETEPAELVNSPTLSGPCPAPAPNMATARCVGSFTQSRTQADHPTQLTIKRDRRSSFLLALATLIASLQSELAPRLARSGVDAQQEPRMEARKWFLLMLLCRLDLPIRCWRIQPSVVFMRRGGTTSA